MSLKGKIVCLFSTMCGELEQYEVMRITTDKPGSVIAEEFRKSTSTRDICGWMIHNGYAEEWLPFDCQGDQYDIVQWLRNEGKFA